MPTIRSTRAGTGASRTSPASSAGSSTRRRQRRNRNLEPERRGRRASGRRPLALSPAPSRRPRDSHDDPLHRSPAAPQHSRPARRRLPRLRPGPGDPGRPVPGGARRARDGRGVRRLRAAVRPRPAAPRPVRHLHGQARRGRPRELDPLRPPGRGHPPRAPASDDRADDLRPDLRDLLRGHPRHHLGAPPELAARRRHDGRRQPRRLDAGLRPGPGAPDHLRRGPARDLPVDAPIRPADPRRDHPAAGRGVGTRRARRTAPRRARLRVEHVPGEHPRDGQLGGVRGYRPAPHPAGHRGRARSRSRSSPG